jgi:hypothetical protein
MSLHHYCLGIHNLDNIVFYVKNWPIDPQLDVDTSTLKKFGNHKTSLLNDIAIEFHEKFQGLINCCLSEDKIEQDDVCV